MKEFNPSKFFKEVKQEGQKIVWPTRKETLITTAMVFVMVLIFSLFFLLVDNIISWFIRLITGGILLLDQYSDIRANGRQKHWTNFSLKPAFKHLYGLDIPLVI